MQLIKTNYLFWQAKNVAELYLVKNLRIREFFFEHELNELNEFLFWQAKNVADNIIAIRFY